MANTGYKINPYITQYFTSGPNSGSQVSSSYVVNLNSSSLTSSINCNSLFEYKIYNPTECTPDIFCTPPTFVEGIASVSNPGVYRIKYNTNLDFHSQSVLEIAYNPSFTGTTASINYDNTLYSASQIITDEIDVSTLLPIYPDCSVSPLYFRVKNICTGSVSSDWSNSSPIYCNTTTPMRIINSGSVPYADYFVILDGKPNENIVLHYTLLYATPATTITINSSSPAVYLSPTSSFITSSHTLNGDGYSSFVALSNYTYSGTYSLTVDIYSRDPYLPLPSYANKKITITATQ